MRYNRRRRIVVPGCDHLVDLFPEPRGPVASNQDDVRRLVSWIDEEAVRSRFEVRRLAVWTDRVLLATRPDHSRAHEVGLGRIKLRHVAWTNWHTVRQGRFSDRFLACAVHASRAEGLAQYVDGCGGLPSPAPLLLHRGLPLHAQPDLELLGDLGRHLHRGLPWGPPEFLRDALMRGARRIEPAVAAS